MQVIILSTLVMEISVMIKKDSFQKKAGNKEKEYKNKWSKQKINNNIRDLILSQR